MGEGEGLQGGDGGEDGRGEGDEHEEGSGECCGEVGGLVGWVLAKSPRGWGEGGGKGRRTGVSEDGNEEHPRGFAVWQLERLPAHDVQDGQRDPEHEQGEAADQAAERHREDHAAPRAGALGRAGVLLVQHLVQAVQHAADADDDVAPRPALHRAVLRAAAAALGAAGLFGRRGVAVGDDEHAGDRDRDGEGFVDAELVAQERDAEGVGEEGGAVVDGGEVARGGEVDGDVPGAAGDGEEGGHEGGRFEHIGDGRGVGVFGGEVEVLGADHLRGGAEEVGVPPPESRPRCLALLYP